MPPPTQIIQGEIRTPITFGTCAPWLLLMHEDVRWDGTALFEIIVSQSAPGNPSRSVELCDTQDVMAGLQFISTD